MAIDFPTSPTPNQVHTAGSRSWTWNNSVGAWYAVNAGVQGIQGALGTQGAQGLQGITGANGSNGSQGTQGIQGLLGIQGAQGSNGTQGIQGIQGTQGTQGLQGITGSQGIQGIQGTAGFVGSNGAQGTQGQQGIQGIQGITGSQGITGAQGITGSTGAQGTQGIQGIQGRQGITGAQGTQGIQGLQGITGAQGTQGVTGSQGITGAQGTQGVTGSQGITGAQGITGSTGAQGTVGTTGSTGTTGATGSTGATGGTGAQGTIGTSVTGVQGAQGTTGASILGTTNTFSGANTFSSTITGSISGTAATATTANALSGLTLNSSAAVALPDNVTQNQIGYNNSVSLFGQTDGGLHSSAYNSSWIHQIYGDFRTGQMAIRGKNNGTWQAWRAVLDASNYTSYSPSLTGSGASGTWGISVSGTATTASNLSNFTNQSGGRYTTDFNSLLTTGFFNAEATPSNSPGGSYGQMIVAKGIDTGFQIYGGYNTDNLWFRGWYSSGGGFSSWRTVLHNGNYNSYSPTLTGGNASGTWGINVTGSAGTLSNNASISGLNFGGVFCLSGSGASTSNSTGARLSENYGPLWNCDNSATWHHQIINGSSLVGFQASGGNYGGGNIYASGNITAYYSDERLKTKIGNIDNALGKIISLNGFTYINNDIAIKNGYKDTKVQVGLSAQEVQAVLPEAVTLAPFDMKGVPETGEIVSKSGENYLTVDYSRLVPLLIEAIKEQQQQIEKQQSQIDELKLLVQSITNK